MNIQIMIGYKGNLSYLADNDFFNALSQVIPPVSAEAFVFVGRLNFRRFAQNGCNVTSKRPEDDMSVVGQISPCAG